MGGRFWRYLAVSGVALLLDYGVLLALVRWTAMHESMAAAASYTLGAVLHYLISRRVVFVRGWMSDRPFSEFAAFIASGLVGLALTTLIVYLATEVATIPLLVSKTAAVFVSFFSTYLIRSSWVFRSR